MNYYAVFENIPLSEGLPTIPDTEIAFVSELPGSAYQIYGPPYYNTSTRRYSHHLLAVLYQDPSGRWMVGTDDISILDKLGDHDTLDNIVSINPNLWHTYKCHAEFDSSGEFEEQILNINTLNKGILIAIEVAPYNYGLYKVARLQATVPSQIGK